MSKISTETPLKLPIGTTQADICKNLPADATIEEVREAIEMVQATAELELAKRKLAVETKKTEAILMRTPKERKYCDEEHPKMLIEHLRSGRGFTTFAAQIMVAPSLLYKWEKSYPKFEEAREIGLALQMASWEDLLLGIAHGTKKGDFKATSFALKNYFPDEYADRREVEQIATQIIIETGLSHRSQVTSDQKIVENKMPQDIDISMGLYKVLEEEEEVSKPIVKDKLTDLV